MPTDLISFFSAKLIPTAHAAEIETYSIYQEALHLKIVHGINHIAYLI